MGLTVRPQTAIFRGASPEVTRAIKTASAESGVSFSYLMTKAGTESGFRPDAKAPTSSATGLFQFIEKTWLGMVKEHGDKIGLDRFADALESGKCDASMRKEILELRKDPKTAALMAAQFASDNRDHLQKTVGGKLEDTELYLAHFLGPAGAEKFLKAYRADPNKSAAEVCPGAAGANRGIFYDRDGARSLREIYDHFAAKFANGGLAEAAPSSAITRPATVASASAAAETRLGAIAWAVKAPQVLSPTAYAARMFMAGLSMPGEVGSRAWMR